MATDQLSGYVDPESASANDPIPTIVVSGRGNTLRINHESDVTSTSSCRGAGPSPYTLPYNRENGSTQARDESNGRLHLTDDEWTPLIGRRSRVNSNRNKIFIIGLVLFIVTGLFMIFEISFLSGLYYALSLKKPENFSLVSNQYPVSLLLTTLTGGLIKGLTLSVSPSSPDDLNVMGVYLLPHYATNWTNSTELTKLTYQAQSAFYALEGSSTVFNVTHVNRSSFSLQLLKANDKPYCQKNFTGQEKSIVFECIIKESDFYRVALNGSGSLYANVSYNRKVIILSKNEPPSCKINYLTNCSLSLSFAKKYYLILNYTQDYSFDVHLEFNRRYELYFFVLIILALYVILLIPFIVWCCNLCQFRRNRIV